MKYKPLTNAQMEMVAKALVNTQLRKRSYISYNDDDVKLMAKSYHDELKMIFDRCNKLCEGEKLRNERITNRVMDAMYGTKKGAKK